MSDEEFFDCQEDNPSNINILGTNVIKRKNYSNYYIEDFEKCEGLGRIAVMDSNNLVMLGKVMSVEYKPYK